MDPGVTVVAQDPAGLGRVAANLLFERLGGLRDAPRRVVLPTALIARGSRRGPAAALAPVIFPRGGFRHARGFRAVPSDRAPRASDTRCGRPAPGCGAGTQNR